MPPSNLLLVLMVILDCVNVYIEFESSDIDA